MGSTGTRLLGIALWQGTKWYVRRRLRATRRLRRAGLIAVAALIAAALVVRRSSS